MQKLYPADTSFRDRLRADLPDDVLRDPAPHYLEEPRGRYKGQAGLIAAPRTTQEVARLISHANAARVAVVPYGGGTGLVGGQIAPTGPAPLILSLERMTTIRAVYRDENVLIAEAGVILSDIQSAASREERLFPLSLASEGSARIGGNLATNAGGTGVLRYGNARDLCLGLEAVLPDGQIWHGLSRLRKDNTGYDLRHLMIGAEGTLGVITAAALKLSPRPQATGTALLTVKNPAAALKLLSRARAHLGDMVTAFELMHRAGFDFLASALPAVRQPWTNPPDWTVLIEIGTAGGIDPAAALETMFADAHAAGLAPDGLIAQSVAQARDFWTLRERIPEANRLIGAIASHDISVPLGALPDFIRQAERTVAGFGDLRINCFGHVGDGNLHYNVFPPEGAARDAYADIRVNLSAALYDQVHALGGSISAEHGVGRLKVADLERYGDPAKLSALRAIKMALDPNGIMNPGAVLRAD